MTIRVNKVNGDLKIHHTNRNILLIIFENTTVRNTKFRFPSRLTLNYVIAQDKKSCLADLIFVLFVHLRG